MILGSRIGPFTAVHAATRMATQQQRRQMQSNALLLRTAAVFAGAPELAVDLDDTPNAAVVFVERLRQLPEAERRRLLQTVGTAAVTLAGYIQTLISAGWPTAAIPFCAALLALIALRDAIDESLRK